MGLQGQLRLGARIVGALGQIAVDRVGEVTGRALPRTREQIADAAVINSLVEQYAPAGQPRLPRVQAASLPGVEFESSNCINFLVALEFAESTVSHGELPKTAYVKLPCPEVATRAFANAVGFWEVEATFCQQVAARVPIRVPMVYAAGYKGARFVLLLENLHESPGTKLFINRDMAAGTTIERARMCLRTFADLHAEFWAWSKEQRDALLPARLHTYLAPGARELTGALNAAAIAPAHKAAPDIFTAEHAAIARMATDKWDQLIDTWYSEPLTLVHGDSHLANFFEYPGPNTAQMGMIDFQGMHWCQGIRDVQYFLINSLEPDLLAAHEDSLIDFYIDQLAQRGVRLAKDLAVQQYRAYAFQTLMVAVTSIGLGTLTERDETVLTILRRSVAAMDRLGFGEWIKTL